MMRRSVGKQGWALVIIVVVTVLAHACVLLLAERESRVPAKRSVTHIEVAMITQASTPPAAPETAPPVARKAPAKPRPAPPPPSNAIVGNEGDANKPPEPQVEAAATPDPKQDEPAAEPAPEPAPAPEPPPQPDLSKGPRATLPGNTSLVFDILFGEQGAPVARLIHDLSITGQSYELKTRGEAVGVMSMFYSGLLLQRSTGQVGPNGFNPERYSEQRGKRPENIAVMDLATRRVRFGNDEHTFAFEPGLQDRLTMVYQLGSIARAATALSVGQVFTMQVASTSDIEPTEFKVIGQETLELGSQTEQTWHFEKVVKQPGKDSQIDVWFGTNKLWLPVQIRVTDKKGLTFLQKLNTDKN